MKHTKLLLAVLLLVPCLSLVGCKHKKEVSRVYRGADGRYYVRAHERKHHDHKTNQDSGGDFIYWVYQDGGSSDFSSSWSRTTSAPSSLSSTGRYVAVKDAKPEEEVTEEEVAEEGDAVIEEQTTESEAETADTDTSSESSSDSSDSSSGDSGGDGGGDGGD